jgi:hypothetical protein
MSATFIINFEQTKKRLEYWTKKNEATPSANGLKWVAIYNDRIAKLETQGKAMGVFNASTSVGLTSDVNTKSTEKAAVAR